MTAMPPSSCRGSTDALVRPTDRSASAASPKFARRLGSAVANVGFKSGTGVMKLQVSYRLRSSLGGRCE